MKQKSTDSSKETQKREAVRGVVSSCLLRIAGVAILFWGRAYTPWLWLHDLLLVLAVAGLITVPFSFVVLRQRLREIERGELDEARKY